MSVKVGIIMGSDSDLPVMSKAAEILDELQVPYERLFRHTEHRTDYANMQRQPRKKAFQ